MPSDNMLSVFNRIYSSEYYSSEFFLFCQSLSNLQKEGFDFQDLLDLSSYIDVFLFPPPLTEDE